MANRIDDMIPDFLLSPQKRIYRHLLLQLVVFLITINIFWDTPDEFIITPARIYSWIGYFLMMDISIYVNTYLLVPGYLLKGRLSFYLMTVLGLLLLSVAIIGSFQTLFEDSRFQRLPSSLPVILLNTISSVISMGLLLAGSSALVLFRHWISNGRRIHEQEAATLHSELKFLKSQINPHFLFNMLNNVYVLIKKGRSEAVEVLVKLEDLLRYQFNDSSQETIQLRSDIHFLNDFLKLEKIRRDNFNYTVSKEGDIDEVWLPPLLFIPFVENAVKHNTDSENTSFVNLSFKVLEHHLVFCCENSKPPVKGEEGGNVVGGLGLKNIRRRLELLYPGRHSLEIVDNEQSYTVNLHLEL